MCSPSLFSKRAITKMGRSKEHSHYSRRVQRELKKNKQMSNACCITVYPMRFNRTSCLWDKPAHLTVQNSISAGHSQILSSAWTFVWNEGNNWLHSERKLKQGCLHLNTYVINTEWSELKSMTTQQENKLNVCLSMWLHSATMANRRYMDNCAGDWVIDKN